MGRGSNKNRKKEEQTKNKILSSREQLKTDMIECYSLACWGDNLWEIDNISNLTMHHILPKRDKGKLTWENVALLSLKFHVYFNKIEQLDPWLAYELTCLFYAINLSYAPPTKAAYSYIDYIVHKAQERHGIIFDKGNNTQKMLLK